MGLYPCEYALFLTPDGPAAPKPAPAPAKIRLFAPVRWLADRITPNTALPFGQAAVE